MTWSSSRGRGAIAGFEVDWEAEAPEPLASMIAGYWARAAEGLGAIGWTYDQAFVLSLLRDAAALDEAQTIAAALGARPLLDRIARMRSTISP